MMNINVLSKRNTTNSRSVTPPPKKRNIPRDKSPIDLMATQKSQKNLKNTNLNNSNGNGSVIQPLENESESFKVYIRSRPISEKELNNVETGKEPNIIKTEDNMIFVLSTIKGKELRPREERSYVFNDVFDESVSTLEMYKKVLTPAVSHIMDGYNSTVLAYGMTGAGKTYTMFGDIYESGGVGVVTLMVKDLFEAFAREEQDGYLCQMKFSYLEIYNEQIKDLLSQQANENLMIIEDPVKGVCIPNLSSHNIDQCEDIINLIIKGNSKRAMASTNSNQFSSRSHAILQITVEKRQRARDIVESVIHSKLCLVDLAGSERAAVSENRGLRQMEGANINRSLLALGNCINVLSDPNTKGAFVPYRDSKLTRLLKDSLGGNTKTVMIACISPFYMAYEETVNTLKYASNARRIKRKIVKNVNEVEMHISEYRDIINSLKSEIGILKKQLQENKGPKSQGFEAQAGNLNTNLENAVDKLGDRLLENLEENSQVNQTLKELSVLKLQNETNLKTKIKELEQSYNDVDVFARISQEIISMKRIMEDNEKIEKEEQLNLQRNLEEKRELQGKVLQLSDQNSKNQPNNALYCQQLEKNLEMLNFERMNLWNQNNQVFQQAQLLARQKAEKDDKILSLESLVYNMQLQLSEKDKMLEYNQQVITSILSQNNPDKNIKSQAQSVVNSFQIQNLDHKESQQDLSVSLMSDKTSRIKMKRIEKEEETRSKSFETPLPEKILLKTYQSKSLKQIEILETIPSRKYKSVSPRKLVSSSKNPERISTVQNKNNITSDLSCIVSTPVEELSLDLSVKDLILDNFNSTRTNHAKDSEKTDQQESLHPVSEMKLELEKPGINLANLLTTATSDQTLGYLDKLSKDLGNYRNSLVSSMGTPGSSELPKSETQTGKYSQQRDRLKEAKIANTNKTPRDVAGRSRSPISNAQINVPSLGVAREFAKNFKIKLNNLVAAAEKNMLEKSCIALISQMAKEYNDYKAYLSENDFVILKKLGMMAIEKFGGEGGQPQMKNTRSNSSNSIAKRNKNFSTEQKNKMPVAPTTPVAVTKKVAESESKVLKKPTGKNLGKAGILSNINSDYSKALNKFCKNQSSAKPAPVKNINIATTHVLCPQKNTNENSPQETMTTPITMKESSNVQEKDSSSIIKALKMSMPVVEVSQFNPEVNLNIINNNRTEMKLKMQKMREKFEQISKKTVTPSESNNETKVEQTTLEI